MVVIPMRPEHRITPKGAPSLALYGCTLALLATRLPFQVFPVIREGFPLMISHQGDLSQIEIR